MRARALSILVGTSLGLSVCLGAATAHAADDDDKDNDGDETPAKGAPAKGTAKAPARASATPGDTTSDAALFARLDADLAEVEKPTERWFTGWEWTFGWVAGGNAAFAATTPSYDQRVLAVVSGTTAVLGLGAMAIQPNTLLGERERMAKMDATTPYGRYERRKRAEYVLHGVAAEEGYWRSPIPHLLGIVAAGASAGILWGAYNLRDFAILQGGLALALIELQVWTRPTLATEKWRAYANDTGAGKPAQQGPDQNDFFSVSLAVAPGGVGLTGTF